MRYLCHISLLIQQFLYLFLVSSVQYDGYFESFDYGESWKRPTAGLKHLYLYGLAVDPADPNIIVVSASQSAWQAHSIERIHWYIVDL